MSLSLPTKQKSTSQASTAVDYANYFKGLDKLTGGRLNDFATEGTPQLNAEQIQAYGGLGATRTADINRNRARALEEINADPNLDVSQRQRARQLTDQDVQSRLEAINKETEAGIAGLAQHNNDLQARDLELLIKAYYGGKGQNTISKGSGGGGASFWG